MRTGREEGEKKEGVKNVNRHKVQLQGAGIDDEAEDEGVREGLCVSGEGSRRLEGL